MIKPVLQSPSTHNEKRNLSLKQNNSLTLVKGLKLCLPTASPKVIKTWDYIKVK